MTDYKLVPVEPTAEMIEAAALAAHRKQGGEV